MATRGRERPQPVGRSERWAIAQQLTDAILRKHGDAVVAIGVHGSLARGDDRSTSDIDFVVVTGPARSTAIANRVLRYREVTIDLGSVDEPDYLAEASALGRTWPLAAEQYLIHRALHDPTGHFERLRTAHQRLIQETPRERFVAASGPHVVAAVDHAAKASERLRAADSPDAWRRISTAALAAAMALGFLEQRYYRNAADAVASLMETGPAELRTDFGAVVSGLDARTAVEHLERGVRALSDYARAQGAQLEAISLDDFARN
jgi:predicted nucleotidyltransferase